MELLSNLNIDFMKYRKFWAVASIVLVVASIVVVFVHGKLNIGIDFAGGTQLTLQFQEEPQIDEIRSVLAAAGLDAQIQRFGVEGAHEVMVRTPLVEGSEEGSQRLVAAALDARYNEGAADFDLNRQGTEALAAFLMSLDPEGLGGEPEARAAHYGGVAEAVVDAREEDGIFSSWQEVAAAPGVAPEVVTALEANSSLGSYSVLAAENVGPQIGRELRIKGLLAVVLSMIGMMIYIWVRFELRFGIGALVATLHDVMVVLGLYALMDYEFNLTTIAAFLTLVGYSVNDTVVIFDRVRENMRKTRRDSLIEIMNRSLNQTMSRTLLTSGTTLLAIGSLLAFGGDVLRGFAFVVTIGIVVGTYSSIYIASTFALLWEQVFGAEARQRRSGHRRATA